MPNDVAHSFAADADARGSRPRAGRIEREDKALAELDAIAALLDSRYRIPRTPIRFGADAVLGLIPGLGDVAAMGPALYMVWRARQLDVPNGLLARMLGNVGVDTLVGSIPLAGSVFDVFFKANRRNHALLRAHLEARRADREAAPRVSSSGSRRR